jgi:hypothetical protein
MQHENIPKIEKVSDTEVWLLNEDGTRTRRICGKVRNGIPEEYPCTEDAGKGTKHEGAGYCQEHDITIEISQKVRNTYSAIIDLDKKRSIMDYLSRSSQEETEHHTSVDSEIELLEALIAAILEANKESITVKKADDIAKVAQKLGNLKKIKIEAMKKEKLDSEIVSRFLKQIMGVIKMHTSQQTTKNIIADIISQVVVPMMHREEMTPTSKKLFTSMVNE